jgi:hypothetical protein
MTCKSNRTSAAWSSTAATKQSLSTPPLEISSLEPLARHVAVEHWPYECAKGKAWVECTAPATGGES